MINSAGQKGAAHLLVPLLLVGGGVIAYLIFASSFPFKDKLFATLYPKPPSSAYEATNSVSGPIKKSPKPSPTTEPFVCNSCSADVNKDGFVNITDFSTVSGCYGKKVNNSKNSCFSADINKDGVVNEADGACIQSMYGKSCPEASSTPTPTPTSVPVIKRVFITSINYNGNMGGLSGADANCQERANAASLGGTWKAWLSDNTTVAASRLTHSSAGYKDLNGSWIASSWTDLTDGTLQNAINVNELGQIKNSWGIWTNTQVDGTLMNYGSTSCSNWQSSQAGVYGALGSNVNISTPVTNSFWTWNSSDYCSSSYPLYCFEQ